MNNLLRVLLLSFSVISGALLLPDSAFSYVKQDGQNSSPRTSQSFAFDNDLLVPGSRDQDYTYGFSMAFAGKGVEDHLASLHEPLDWIDQYLGLNQQNNSVIESSKIEYGVFGFTPEDISLAQPAQGDRPYAGLIYVSSTNEHYNPTSQVSWQSTLTLGVMGLSIVGDVQDAVHSAIGSNRPQGWKNEISEGGEPTARYSLSQQNLRYKNDSGLEIKTTLQGSIGYITEASWSVSMRAGKIHTPWVSFNPELTSYGEKSTPANSGKISEHYFWTGLSLKARAYNAFLQGQFKDSEVSYASDEVNHGIIEAWAGYTVAMTDGYSFTYSLRGHTSELKQGAGDRNVVWGGLLVSKTFN